MAEEQPEPPASDADLDVEPSRAARNCFGVLELVVAMALAGGAMAWFLHVRQGQLPDPTPLPLEVQRQLEPPFRVLSRHAGQDGEAPRDAGPLPAGAPQHRELTRWIRAVAKADWVDSPPSWWWHAVSTDSTDVSVSMDGSHLQIMQSGVLILEVDGATANAKRQHYVLTNTGPPVLFAAMRAELGLE